MFNASGKKARAVCAVLPVAAPWLLLGVLSLLLQTNAMLANPIWADEIVFYRTVKAFCESGIPAASNGIFEASATLGQFGSAGLVPILLYGLPGYLFGVTPHTVLICNALWVSVAALVFVLLRKPSCKVSIVLFATLVTYVPFILYIATSMTEIFSYALLLFYLTFLLNYHEKRSKASLVLCIATCMLACFYRSYYGWLAVPLALAIGQFRFSKKTLLAMAALLAAGFACCLMGECFICTNYNSFLYRLLQSGSLSVSWRMLLSHVKSNLLDVFARGDCNPVERLLLLGYAAMMLITLLGALTGGRRGRSERAIRLDLLGIFLLLGALLVTTVCLYDLRDWRAFRILSPVLWMAILYTVCRGYSLPAGVTGVFSLLSLLWLLTNPPIGAFADGGRFTQMQTSKALSQAAAYVTYSDKAQSPFDNTVRTDLYSLQLAQELDPKLGIQHGWLSTDTVEKSRWLITDYLRCVVTGYSCAADFGEYKVYERIPVEEVGE